MKIFVHTLFIIINKRRASNVTVRDLRQTCHCINPVWIIFQNGRHMNLLVNVFFLQIMSSNILEVNCAIYACSILLQN